MEFLKFKNIKSLAVALFMAGITSQALAQNPIIHNQFTADPSARVFGDKVYLFPSHDILANKERGRIDWFCMEDYHVFSSSNLTDWEDHGVIVTQNKVPWVKPDSYSMWAPDCIERNGKYYFYFPSTPKDSTLGRGFKIGVAVADRPEGPYIPEALPIKNVNGIDPNVFIDNDGQAYLYWSAGNIYGAKLNENMLELASDPVILQDLPTKGLKEGPYLFERGGIYYLTYPHVENKTERLEYAISDNPLGPFKFKGVIMDETPGCWTNHHSILPFKNQWYLFYHANDFSPAFDKARSARIDSLFFNADGTIQKVIPTLRGVGLTKATDKIQIDRYSQISESGASVAFLDTADKFNGWKTVLSKPNAWVKYNSVDFGSGNFKNVVARVSASKASDLQILLNKGTRPIVIKIPATSGAFQTIKVPVAVNASGIHHITVKAIGANAVDVDWIRFE
ncbi:alpha-N-arabinofuranosidase [Pelobium manganitolerans]|uniref:Alpha-N-arabinofuranosidase n=1 Tax=Pelobium manganitolerans TaxID=1842495 RepID=A0A419S2T2_9SPHI|nr:family 43 glycosylhydrolase [Pelobium manganitolerans]RKD13301.1 alpha-N-arabinofuranosidase [Pelobium manganitolerans]